MNKRELIERIEGLENLFGNKSEYIEIDTVIRLISELDEPQKVKVPQFVADWIEVCKEHLTTSLYTAMNPNFMKENNQSFDLTLWIKKTSNQETFARAWLDGYEVEEEKRYHVKINGEIEENLLVYGLGIHRYFFARTYDSSKRNGHTRKELEDNGFGWVFDCPGIEIEEVE